MYTSPILLPLVAHLLESFDAMDKLEGFVTANGRAFYNKPAGQERIALRRKAVPVTESWEGEDGTKVVTFWAGREIGWEIVTE